MDEFESTVSLRIDVPLDPVESFDTLFEELVTALSRNGYRVETGPEGRIVRGDAVIGAIVSWVPGERVVFEWRPAPWNPGEVTEVAVLFESTDDGTSITLEHRGWGRSIADPADLVGWFAEEAVTPFVDATAPAAYGDWLTDRRARRPAGAGARDEYGDPLYHYPNFRVILETLALTPDDYLLEVGCGGGALLADALESGCRAAAVDHSPEMVQLARRNNRTAVEAGRLDILEADADELPFPDGTFTCAVMTGVLGHLPDPAGVFDEIHRALETDGRIVILGSDPELRGTPAAPEPMAARMRFYTTEELEHLAGESGFGEVTVERHNLESYARDVGVPDEHLPLFDYASRFLVARKA